MMTTQDDPNRGLQLSEIIDGWRQLHGLGKRETPFVARHEDMGDGLELFPAGAAASLYDLISTPCDFTSESWHCAVAVLSEAMRAKSDDPAISAKFDATRATIADTSAILDLAKLSLAFAHDVAQRLGVRVITRAELERCHGEGLGPPAMPGFTGGNELFWFWPTGDPDELARQWNDAVAAAICGVGPEGAQVAARMLEINEDNTGHHLWDPWRDFDHATRDFDVATDGPTGPTLTVQAWWIACTRAIWRDQLLGELTADLERKRRVRPALVRPLVHDIILTGMTGHRQLSIPGTDDPRTIRDARGREIGRVAATDAATIALVFGGLDMMGSVHWHRMLRAMVLRSHDAWMCGDPYFFQVVFDRAWVGLAEAIGYKSPDNRPLKMMAHAGQHLQWRHPRIEINALWSWMWQRGSPGNAAKLTFSLNSPLLPNYVHTLTGTSTGARIAKRLIPELRSPPPVAAVRTNEQGAVWTLHRMAVAEMVDQGERMAHEGGAVLNDDWWRLKAKAAGLPTATDYIAGVRGNWLEGDDDAPPLLKLVDRDRYTLADSHQLERLFIEEGGRKRIRGGVTGRRGKRAKASKGTP